jgi:hypothetical protein
MFDDGILTTSRFGTDEGTFDHEMIATLLLN